ncbi:MAG: hypothetical protein Q7Q73_01250 [Verrucomicrobiota bacterium JB024]|nr:hypothetical protein [Verrucomicrobiota bacterium JB024]
MDSTQAKAILSAYRADMPDADEAAFAEALEQVGHDPELAQWFEDEQNFDEIFAGKLHDIQPPADLKDKLLALDPDKKTIPFPQPESDSSTPKPQLPGQRPWWKRSSILSAAATVAVLLGFGAVLLDPSKLEAEPELNQFYDQLGDNFRQNPKLTGTSNDLDDIRGKLRASGLRAPGALPPKVDSLAEVGFGSFSYKGTTISYVVESQGNQTFCLYLLDKSLAGNALPQDGTPVIFQQEDLAMMAWVGPQNLCVLIVRGPVEEMNNLR